MQDFSQTMQLYFGPFSAGEAERVKPFFRQEVLEKNEYFSQAGKRCDRLSIIQSGILRVYALADGKEVTQWLAAENSMLTDVTGFFFEQPNRWDIQALTETSLLTIRRDDYKKLCAEFPKWNEIEKQLVMQCFATMESRIFSHLSLTAEERYNLYYRQNARLFKDVPLQYIASVLGMTPETFSRIRKKQLS